jgi:CBS domain-containing protein
MLRQTRVARGASSKRKRIRHSATDLSDVGGAAAPSIHRLICLNAARGDSLSLSGRGKNVAMRAMDLMTTEVVTVDPDTSVQLLAALPSERGISGEPVVDGDNRVVGIVSEGDLLHRVETGTEQRTGHRRSWRLDTIASDRELARDYVKSHGRAVKDVMTARCRLGQRYDRARRHRNSARDKADQARAGRLRRQARRHP